MSLNDPIADMLTRIRNACASKHRRVDMPVSNMKIEIARILKENQLHSGLSARSNSRTASKSSASSSSTRTAASR